MADAIKICPICSASNHRNAALCWNCGTSLEGIAVQGSLDDTTNSTRPKVGGTQYSFKYGETDLYEADLYHIGQRYLYGCFGSLILLMIIGLGLVAAPPAVNAVRGLVQGDNPTPTNQAQIILPTITQGPPTLTPTITVLPTATPTIVPTREPCVQTVQAGDLMFDVVNRCGHLSFDVFEEVVEINDLDNAGMIFEGQSLIIPWPTEPAPPPADQQSAITPEAQTVNADTTTQEDVDVLELSDEELEEFLIIPTATLPPGVAWYKISTNDTLFSIIAQYETSVEVMSQLNPEISFSQCNMGMTFGGERCNVMVFQGQDIRVPVTLPPPTATPTPNGSETPTPTATATFNAPVAQNPADRAFFRRDDLITLRWIPSGTLASDETYRVTVEDRTGGILYTADTVNTSFIMPDEWQGVATDDIDRHQYAWTVSVININNPDNVIYRTPIQTFTWETQESSD